MSRNRNLAIVKTHQFKKSSGLFETIQERKIKFHLRVRDVEDRFNVYVDDRYCIFDWDYMLFQWNGFGRSGFWTRHIQVRCINTLELIHDRDFGTARGKEKGYKGGIILVRSEQSNHSIIAWDGHNNRITPINYFSIYTPQKISLPLFTNYNVSFWQSDLYLRGKYKIIMCLQKIQETATRETQPLTVYFDLLDKYWKNVDVLYCDGIQVFGRGGAEELVVVNFINESE